MHDSVTVYKHVNCTLLFSKETPERGSTKTEQKPETSGTKLFGGTNLAIKLLLAPENCVEN